MPEAIRKSQRDKIASIEEAQAAGRLTTTYLAADLLNVVWSLSLTQTAADAAGLRPEHYGRVPVGDPKRLVITAVTAILAS